MTRQTTITTFSKQQTIVADNIPTMAAVAQQYYEEAAQNEQMGEEDEGVSNSFYCVRIMMREIPWQCIRAEAVGRVHSLKYYFLLVIYMGG